MQPFLERVPFGNLRSDRDVPLLILRGNIGGFQVNGQEFIRAVPERERTGYFFPRRSRNFYPRGVYRDRQRLGKGGRSEKKAYCGKKNGSNWFRHKSKINKFQ